MEDDSSVPLLWEVQDGIEATLWNNSATFRSVSVRAVTHKYSFHRSVTSYNTAHASIQNKRILVKK